MIKKLLKVKMYYVKIIACYKKIKTRYYYFTKMIPGFILSKKEVFVFFVKIKGGKFFDRT